jgi:hypothetical protein
MAISIPETYSNSKYIPGTSDKISYLGQHFSDADLWNGEENPSAGDIPMKTFRYVLSVFLFGLLALTAVFAFRWRYYHDIPIFFYISLLIDKFGVIPYRDLYELNMPGTYFVALIIGKLTGYSELSVRILDYILLAVLIGLGGLWMRKLNLWAGLMGGAAWALAYLALGPTAMMQREYMMLIPILCGLAAYTNIPPRHTVLRFLLTGIFLGMAVTIKPQAFVGMLPIAAMEWHAAATEPDPSLRKKSTASLRRILFWLGIGFLAPLAVMFLYLAVHGALPQFLEIVFKYLPLFAQMNGNHQAVSGVRRVYTILLDYIKLGGYGIWIAPALWGIYLLRQSDGVSAEKKRLGMLLLWYVITFSIYPAFSGQFFPQHWLIFAFLLFQAAFICVTMNAAAGSALFRWLPAALLLVASLTLVRPDTLDNLWLLAVKHELPAANNPKEGRVDEIAAFLETHLQPGDTVQPVDWVGGAVHAMLIARVKQATSFIYDEYFYHNVNDPYIQQLRARFIIELERARPRFIVEVYDDGPFAEPTGPNTSREFPELRAFLAENYSVVQEGQGYRIYELRPE